MKLHLPSGLRKALLACLAAVALPAASIPTTLASASGIAAVFLATSQRASAEEAAWPDTQGWATDSSLNEQKKEASYTTNTVITLPQITFAGETSQGYTLSGTDNVSIKIDGGSWQTSKGGLRLKLSNFDKVWITGTARFSFEGDSDDGAAFNNIKDLYVNGAAQAFFRVTQATNISTNFHLGQTSINDAVLGTAATAALAYQVDITTTGYLELIDDAKIASEKGTFTVKGEVKGVGKKLEFSKINNQWVDTGGTLALEGGGELKELSSTDKTTVKLGGESKTYTLGGGNMQGKLEFAGTASLSLSASANFSVSELAGTMTSLILGDNATFDVKTGKLALTGTLSFGDGSRIKLETSSQQISLGNNSLQSMTSSGKTLTIELDSSFFSQDSGTITLFSTWQNSWSSLFSFVASGGGSFDDIHIDDGGKLVWTGTVVAADYTWTGSGTTVTLGDTVSNTNDWSASGNVDNSKTVALEGSGNTVTVTVDGGEDGVSMKSLTVGKTGEETKNTYTFSAESARTLNIQGSLTIHDNVNFASNVSVTANSMSVMDGSCVTFEGGGTMNITDVDIQSGGEVVIKQEGNLTTNKGFHGQGKLTVDWSASETSKDFINFFQNTITPSNADTTLETLEFKNAYIEVQGDGNLAHFKNLHHVIVGENSSFLLDAPGTGNNKWGSDDIVLHLNGTGVKGTPDTQNGTVADAALSFFTHSAYYSGGSFATAFLTVATPWSITLEGDATVRIGRDTGAEGRTLQLNDTLDFGTNHTLTKIGSGALEFTGNSFKTSGSGTIKVEKGALKLSYTTNGDALRDHTINLTEGTTLESGITGTVKALSGTGTLNVTGGKLTLGTADGSTLTNLAIGSGESGAELVVSAGSFTISGGWTWGAGSKLSLSASGQQITLSSMEQLNGGSSGSSLTIHLSDAFLEGGTSGELVLFANGFQSTWKDYFTFETDEGSLYSNVQLTDDGKLTWDTVEVNELTWMKNGASDNWSATGTDANWNEGSAWDNSGNTKAIFNDTAGETVTVLGSVKTGAVEVKQGGSWEFQVDSGNSLTVSRDLTVSGSAKLKLSGKGKIAAHSVDLTAGSLELNGADLQFGSITGGASSLTGTGYALYAGGGSMSWSDFLGKYGSVLGGSVGVGAADQALTITDDVSLDQSFKAGDNSKATFSGNVTFNTDGKLVLGDDAEIVLGGTLAKRTGDVSVTHEGTEGGMGKLTMSVGGNAEIDMQDMSFGEGVILHVDGPSSGTGVTWGTIKNLNVLGELQLAGHEVILNGTNTIKKLDASGLTGKFSLTEKHEKTTLQSSSEVDVEVDMRAGELAIGTGTDDEDTTLTLKGGLRKNSGSGDMKITGANLTFAGSFAEHEWEGGLDLKKLTMSGGTQKFTGTGSNATLSVGSLVVTGGSLTMGSADKEMTVKTGGINITGGTFTWAGSKMTVSGDITMSGVGAFEVAYSSGLELAWSGATINDSITLTLTGFADAQVTDGGYTLFGTSGWKSEWAGKILVKGTTTEGKQLTLDENGKVVILADGKDLYWPGSGADTELTWGANGGAEWAESAGAAAGASWTTNSHVHLGATGAATVTLKDAAITAADITFTAANATDGYTFTSGVEEGSTLLVRGNMSNKNDNSSVAVKAVFDDKVNVRVMGDFISTGAKGDFLFKKKLTVDGLLQLWNGSVLELDEGGDVGTLDTSWNNNGTIKLGKDLKVGNWFFEGAYQGGHQAKFEKTGEAEEVFIEVGRVVGGLSGTQSQASTLSERELTINNGDVSMTIGEGVGIKKSSGTLTFGEGNVVATFAVGGSYAAVSGGEMVFNVDATAGMNVEIGEGSSITVKEGKSLTADGKLKGTGGALLLESSATATFTGGVDTSSNLTSLQLAQGAKLSALGASTLDVGTLTLTGNATIDLSGPDKGKIKLGSAIVGADQHALTITLTGLTDDQDLLNNGYQLFDSTMDAAVLKGLETLFIDKKLTIDLDGCSYDIESLDATGKLTFSNEAIALTYSGNGGDFTWSDKGTGWENGAEFDASKTNDVTFKGTGDNTVKLDISGETKVRNMTVNAESGTYTFASDSGSNALTVRRKLDLQSAATFKVDTTVEDQMTGSGALTVDGKTFTLSRSGRDHEWTGELTVQNAGTFSLAGTVTATKFTVGTDGGTVDLSGAGAVLTVTGDIAGDGNALTVTGGGKLDWTGTTGTLGSADIENGEFAIGGTLTMGGNIALGQNGKISGSGTIEKKSGLAGDVYVQFQVDGDESAGKAVDAWVTDKLGGLQLGDGVSLQKSGEGMLTFGSGGTLSKALDIAEGSVKFDGNNYTVSEALTGAGTLIIATAGPNRTVTLSKGANMTGDLSLSCYGGSVTLGANATFGGLVNDGDNFNYLSTGGRTHGIKSGDDNVTLTLNVAEGEKEAKGVNIGEGVKVVKDGEGTQKFTKAEDTDNGRVTLAGGLEVNKGVLEITGEHSTIGGALTGGTEGTLRLVSGNLAISGGGTHGGTLEMTEGKITVSGAALEVGTFKATTGELDVQSDLTIGTVGEGSTLTTLKIASDTTVAVRAGTLKAGALDLTGTTGVGFVIDMTGQAKLDFGSITLGKDGKLAITMTGYDGEKSYQLFESTTFGDVWDAHVTGGKQWNEVFDITGIEGRDLTLNRDGSITIQPKGIDWSGSSDDTWSDNQSGEWEGGTVPPTGRDVTFTAEAAQEHGDVQIDGTVHPRNVDVDGGDYTFRQKEGTTGGLNMSETEGGGTLKVGGGGVNAKLTLELENTSIPRVELEKKGTLVLAHDKALTDETEILFSGGELEYSGVELSDPDLSGRILKYGKGGSTGAVKVSVDGATYADGVTWGGAEEDVASNGGLWHAVHESVNQGGGMEKSGTGQFTLEWQESETETGEPTTHRGAVTVKEGELQYKIHTAGATDVTMRGGVTVEKDGTFTVSVYGEGVVEYIEALNGEGTVSLGGEDGEGTVKLSGDSSGFKGTVGITSGIVEVGNENALGGGDATLELSGGNLTGNDITVNAGNVVVSGGDAVLSGVTLAGKVTGESGVTAKDGATAGLSGDISEYEGELKTGESGTWKLSDKALSQPVGVAVSGNGVVEFAGDATYSGKVSDSVTLRGSDGKLTVTSQGSSTVAKLDGNVTLGNLETQARWDGTELVSGDIVLSNVVLGERGIGNKGDAKLYVDTAKGGTATVATVATVAAYSAREATPQGGIVNVSGMAGSKLDGITINEHGQLQGITGRYTANSEHQLELHFSGENVSDTATGAQALITAGTAGFNLNASSKADVGLYLETDAVASIIGKLAEATSDATVDVYLHLLEGGELRMGDLKLTDLKGDDVGILSSLYIESVMAEGGNIRLTGSAADVYVAPKGNSTLTDEDRGQLDKAGATVLANPGDHLTLSMDGETSQPEEGPDVIVKNLLGVTGSQLSLENSSKTDPTVANRLEVAFNNTHASTLANADKYPGEIDGTTVYGQDTTFNGNIDGGEGVDVRKQGLGTLTVGGTYTLADGTTTLAEGALRLRGDGNSMGNLAFSYDKPRSSSGKQGADGEVKEEERGLLLEGGTTTITGSITEKGSNADGDDINLSQGAKLTLTGDNTLEKTTITGDEENGSGTLVLDGEGAALTLDGSGSYKHGNDTLTAQLSGVDVQLTNKGNLTLGDKAGMDAGKVELGKGGTLDIGSGTANHVDSLGPITEEDGEGGTTIYRDGTLKSAEGGELHVGGGSFSGTLGMSDGATSAGTLAVDSGAEFTLDNAKSEEGAAWGVELGDGANLTVNVSGKYADGTEAENPGKLTLGNIELGNGKMTVNYGDRINQNPLTGTITGVGEKGTLDFFSSGEVENGDTGITVAEGLREDFEKHITFSGVGNFLKDNTPTVDSDTGKITVSSKEAEDNKFERLLPDMSKNARAGATMVWDSLKEKSQDEAFFNALLNPTSDYDSMASALIGMYDSGDKEGLEKALVAVAGSSISVLGPAVVDDLHRQLTTMRNRTTMTTNEQHLEQYDEYPMWHAWLNAEGAYRELDADGFAPGYTLNSWGGTVGVDADVSERTTVGLALTAMFGDLKTDGADVGKGDLDTMYLSAFARTTRGAWSHTFVMSAGMADVSLGRTVNVGGVSYRTQGSTDGFAVGALYEVGYTKLVNRRGTVAFQPVFNVELRHAAIKGYTETGSNAGLRVDDIEQDVVTFGVGARMQGIVGENLYNRTSILEGRLLVKGDVGDRSGVSKNALIGSTRTGEVESAEVGALGIEAGVGLSIPLGSQLGNLFFDASVELRSGQTSFDATVGYRISF